MLTSVSGTERPVERAARTTLAVALGELRFVVGTFAQAFVRAGGVVTLLTLALLAWTYVSSLVAGDELAREPLAIHVVVWVVLFGYALFVGAQGGLVLALPWTAWKLAGPWIVVPLVVLPISVIVSMVLCAPLTALAGEALWGAIVEAGRDHDWLVAELGPAARAGPIALVFAIPLLLVDLGAILLEPSVLLHLVLAVLALALSILLGLVPSGIVSLLAVAIGYARRFWQRHGETIAGPAEPSGERRLESAPPAA